MQVFSCVGEYSEGIKELQKGNILYLKCEGSYSNYNALGHQTSFPPAILYTADGDLRK